MSSMLSQYLQPSASHLVDQLHFMLEQEETHYSIGDYFHPSTTVTPSDRRTLVSWSYEIVDACSIDREVAAIAVSYLDRFMCKSSPRAQAALSSRREFQLVYIACLVIALKCRAGMKIDSDFVVDSICQGLYDEGEINGTERCVLDALGWRLNGPTPHDFVEGFVRLLPPATASNAGMISRLTLTSRIWVEAAVLDYSTSLRPPSSIACAALLASMLDTGADEFALPDRLAWMRSIHVISRRGTVPAPAANSARNDRDGDDTADGGPSSGDGEEKIFCCMEVSSAAEANFYRRGAASPAAEGDTVPCRPVASEAVPVPTGNFSYSSMVSPAVSSIQTEGDQVDPWPDEELSASSGQSPLTNAALWRFDV